MKKLVLRTAVALMVAMVTGIYVPGTSAQGLSIVSKVRAKTPVITEQYLVSGYSFDGSTVTVRIDPATDSITMVFSYGTATYSYKGNIDTYSYRNGDYEVTGEVQSDELDDMAYVAFIRNSMTGEYSGIFHSYYAPIPSSLIPI